MNTATFEQSVDPSSYMLRLAATPTGRTYKSLALTHLQLEMGHSVVDLGCGPGADLIRYAHAVGPAGVVIGVDRDEAALDRARQETAGLAQVEIRHGEIEALDLPAETFDAVHTDRVLQHVERPERAIAEAVRVLKPGGRAVFAEPDWHTLLIDHPDLELSRAYVRYVTDHQVRNAALGRQLPRLLRQAGLVVESVVPVTTVFDDARLADQILGFSRVTQRAVAYGLMTPADGRRWLDHLAASPFFASVTIFIAVARRLLRAQKLTCT